MRHRTARRLMSLAMDRRIPRDQESRLLEHVERCPRCRETWAAMLRAESLLKGAPLLEPPQGFVLGVLARLPSSRRRPIAVVPLAWRRAGLLVGIAAGAVALGTLIAVLLLATGWLPAVSGRPSGAWVGALWDGMRALFRTARPVGHALWHAFGIPGLVLALAGIALAVAFWRLGNRCLRR